MNPYAQGGWSNPLSQFPGAAGGPIPSIHGALPHLPAGIPAGREQDLARFRFEPQGGSNPSVLSSTVMDSNSRPRFYITTTNGGGSVPDVTSIKDESGGLAATIEWQLHPVVQLKTYINDIPRQFSSQFLPLSQSQTSRTMTVKGKNYQWTRDPERDCVYFHNVSYTPREFLGVLSRASDGAVIITLLPTTVAQGLLDVTVLVATMFYSNRNID
ncbi:hypothetical protein DFP72DRAFT_1067034 [Ephemerocybe angulata]|uniref:DUF6593 domain-containing protein n=1 Tax=Ephemerocybe angulata TaxID=980116 RepID=A0A8H6M9N2_9AGAR|nr:hypothetical protein DFP72DRAFT_1067034 [Tulosesus angulatus]